MRRRLTYSFLTISILFLLKTNWVAAQTWTPVDSGCYLGSFFAGYGDSSRELLYVGGSFDSCGSNFYSVAGFASWDGSSWYNLTGGENTFGGDWTYCITKYAGHIYHGMRDQSGSLGNVFKEEQADSNRIGQMNGSVYCMAVYNNELYIGGIFDHIVLGGNTSIRYAGIARWNGTIWKTVGAGVRATSDSTSVKAMFVWKNKLYVGGRFDSAGKISCKNLAVWDGASWQACGQGVTNAFDNSAYVSALGAYANTLIIGGKFDRAGNLTNVNCIASFNGQHAWSNLGITLNDEVDAICTYKNDMYVGGRFAFESDSGRIARYDGNNWFSLGSGSWEGSGVRALTVWHESLYVLGRFSLANGMEVNNIARWTIGPRKIPIAPSINMMGIADDQIHLSVDESLYGKSYLIFNELGQAVSQGEISESMINGIITVSTGSLPAGFYILKIYGGTSQNGSFCFMR